MERSKEKKQVKETKLERRTKKSAAALRQIIEDSLLGLTPEAAALQKRKKRKKKKPAAKQSGVVPKKKTKKKKKSKKKLVNEYVDPTPLTDGLFSDVLRDWVNFAPGGLDHARMQAIEVLLERTFTRDGYICAAEILPVRDGKRAPKGKSAKEQGEAELKEVEAGQASQAPPTSDVVCAGYLSRGTKDDLLPWLGCVEALGCPWVDAWLKTCIPPTGRRRSPDKKVGKKGKRRAPLHAVEEDVSSVVAGRWVKKITSVVGEEHSLEQVAAEAVEKSLDSHGQRAQLNAFPYAPPATPFRFQLLVQCIESCMSQVVVRSRLLRYGQYVLPKRRKKKGATVEPVPCPEADERDKVHQHLADVQSSGEAVLCCALILTAGVHFALHQKVESEEDAWWLAIQDNAVACGRILQGMCSLQHRALAWSIDMEAPRGRSLVVALKGLWESGRTAMDLKVRMSWTSESKDTLQKKIVVEAWNAAEVCLSGLLERPERVCPVLREEQDGPLSWLIGWMTQEDMLEAHFRSVSSAAYLVRVAGRLHGVNGQRVAAEMLWTAAGLVGQKDPAKTDEQVEYLARRRWCLIRWPMVVLELGGPAIAKAALMLVHQWSKEQRTQASTVLTATPDAERIWCGWQGACWWPQEEREEGNEKGASEEEMSEEEQASEEEEEEEQVSTVEPEEGPSCFLSEIITAVASRLPEEDGKKWLAECEDQCHIQAMDVIPVPSWEVERDEEMTFSEMVRARADHIVWFARVLKETGACHFPPNSRDVERLQRWTSLPLPETGVTILDAIGHCALHLFAMSALHFESYSALRTDDVCHLQSACVSLQLPSSLDALSLTGDLAAVVASAVSLASQLAIAAVEGSAHTLYAALMAVAVAACDRYDIHPAPATPIVARHQPRARMQHDPEREVSVVSQWSGNAGSALGLNQRFTVFSGDREDVGTSGWHAVMRALSSSSSSSQGDQAQSGWYRAGALHLRQFLRFEHVLSRPVPAVGIVAGWDQAAEQLQRLNRWHTAVEEAKQEELAHQQRGPSHAQLSESLAQAELASSVAGGLGDRELSGVAVDLGRSALCAVWRGVLQGEEDGVVRLEEVVCRTSPEQILVASVRVLHWFCDAWSQAAIPYGALVGGLQVICHRAPAVFARFVTWCSLQLAGAGAGAPVVPGVNTHLESIQVAGLVLPPLPRADRRWFWEHADVGELKRKDATLASRLHREDGKLPLPLLLLNDIAVGWVPEQEVLWRSDAALGGDARMCAVPALRVLFKSVRAGTTSAHTAARAAEHAARAAVRAFGPLGEGDGGNRHEDAEGALSVAKAALGVLQGVQVSPLFSTLPVQLAPPPQSNLLSPPLSTVTVDGMREVLQVVSGRVHEHICSSLSRTARVMRHMRRKQGMDLVASSLWVATQRAMRAVEKEYDVVPRVAAEICGGMVAVCGEGAGLVARFLGMASLRQSLEGVDTMEMGRMFGRAVGVAVVLGTGMDRRRVFGVLLEDLGKLLHMCVGGTAFAGSMGGKVAFAAEVVRVLAATYPEILGDLGVHAPDLAPLLKAHGAVEEGAALFDLTEKANRIQLAEYLCCGEK